jgi:hypothetical protein
MVKNISPKQRRIVKAKIKGVKNKDIGKVEYPNATPDSQAVLVSRELQKGHVAQYLEQSKLQALKEHKITWSRIIKPISDGLKATHKIYDKEGNVLVSEPDLNTQMRASKQASELLRVKEEIDPVSSDGLKLPDDIDEIQLIKLIKNK